MSVCPFRTERLRAARGALLGVSVSLVAALCAASLVAPLTSSAQVSAPVPAVPAPVPKALEQLLSRFAQMPGFEARFTEEKRVALLAKPLVSEGRLWFAPPGLLLRRVEAPALSEVVITPTELRMKDAHGSQTLDLRARADVRPFVESLTWLLSGNRKALLAVYDAAYDVEAGSKRFKLTLTPKAPPISNVLAFIRVSGEGNLVREVLIAERSGDETRMTITAPNPARRFTKEELVSLFGYSPQ